MIGRACGQSQLSGGPSSRYSSCVTRSISPGGSPARALLTGLMLTLSGVAAYEMAQSTLNHIRSLSHTLHPSILDGLGLRARGGMTR